MKSNLDKKFKTDEKLEKDGIIFRIDENIHFVLRRWGGSNAVKVKAAMAKYYKPFARQVELDTLPQEENNKILVKAFCEACLVDWKGVEIDGEVAECNFDNGVKLFVSLPELFDSLYKHCSSHESFKEDLGNF